MRTFEKLVLIGISVILVTNLAILALLTSSRKIGPQRPDTFYEAVGVLTLAEENLYKSAVPTDSLLLTIGKEKFPAWNLQEQRTFLLYNALADGNSAAFRTILVDLAAKNGLLSLWRYDLEFLHDNCSDPSTKNKCALYIQAVMKAEEARPRGKK